MNSSVPGSFKGPKFEPWEPEPKMKARRDIMTPAIVITGIVIVILFLWAVLANGQTSKTPIKNGILQSNLDAAGFKVIGLATPTLSSDAATKGYADSVGGGGGGSGTVTSITATTPIVVTPSPLVATGVISVTVGSSGGVQAWDADLDTWATKTPYAGTVTVTTGKTFNATGTLTYAGTDGSTLNIGTGGTLGTAAYTASTAYQAQDVDLGTWAGISPSVQMQSWIGTPSSANLRGAVTDENGTGALLFNGATTPDFTTGFTIGAAAASGKILVGNGTNFVPSTPTYPNAASPTARKFIVSDGTNWVASTETQAVPGTSGNVLTSDGTNWTSAAPVVTASNTLTFTNKRVTPRVTSTASATTWAPSADTDDVYEITGQTAPVTTISNPAGTPVDGQSLIIRFKDNGTARALSWTGSQWEAGPGMTLPASTIVGNHDYAGFKWNSTTSKWTMVACTQLSGTVDDTAYAASWNGVTGLSPSKNAVYDELHKIDSADDGTIVNAGTGFRIAGAATSNYELTGNGTNFISKASDIPNGSSAQQTGFSSNTYLAGSVITISAGDFKVGSTYRCMFDMAKTTAGTAAPVITIYIGTAGTTSDTAAQTITFAAATGVADTGMFEVWVNFRAVGASATISSVGRCVHNLAITGLTSTGAAGSGTVSNSTSSTFNSTTFTKIGVAFNGGASYVGTNNLVQAYYSNP